MKKCQVVGYKITVGLDNEFNPSHNSKYTEFFIAEDLEK